MSASILGSTYTPLVSGSAITSGGAANGIGGGAGVPGAPVSPVAPFSAGGLGF